MDGIRTGSNSRELRGWLIKLRLFGMIVWPGHVITHMTDHVTDKNEAKPSEQLWKRNLNKLIGENAARGWKDGVPSTRASGVLPIIPISRPGCSTKRNRPGHATTAQVINWFLIISSRDGDHLSTRVISKSYWSGIVTCIAKCSAGTEISTNVSFPEPWTIGERGKGGERKCSIWLRGQRIM